jgi:hypothetical protein
MTVAQFAAAYFSADSDLHKDGGERPAELKGRKKRILSEMVQSRV